MHIRRLFTKPDSDPLAKVEFAKFESLLHSGEGEVLFHQQNVEAPVNWSGIAIDILAQKYFRKKGVCGQGIKAEEPGVPAFLQPSVKKTDGQNEPADKYSANGNGESSARDVFHRLAGFWAYWGWKGGYFTSQEDAETFYDEIVYMLAHQMAAPNSPQWFNSGLNWAYGISGEPHGHYIIDAQTGSPKKAPDAYTYPQIHACFIQSVDDDLVGENGIMSLWHREARVFKFGSGTGTNFSAIRAKGEPLQGGGTASGLLSFLKVGDRAAGAIKSGGTTRRAAKMVVVDDSHPDVLDFIRWKVMEERKVASLISGSYNIHHALKNMEDATRSIHSASKSTAFDPQKNPALGQAIAMALEAKVPRGMVENFLLALSEGITLSPFPVFDADWNHEAYQSVSGQNANNSVRLSGAFMQALQNDQIWQLLRRSDGLQDSALPARRLWHEIALAAWEVADPAVQFQDTISGWHTCANSGEIHATNPCAEYMFLDDTACNLASLNLLAFLDEAGNFDETAFLHAVRLWTIVLDISVGVAQYPSQRVAEKSVEFRTIGLGYTNLGALLMGLALPYDSEGGRAVCASLSSLMTAAAYKTSCELAAELGTFPAFAKNKDAMLRVLRNHTRAARGVLSGYEDLISPPLVFGEESCPLPGLTRKARALWAEVLQKGERGGFRNAQISAIAPTGTISLVMDCDTTGIEPDYALVKFKKLAGGGYFKLINKTVPLALKKLGYSKQHRESILLHALGHASLKKAPAINHKSLEQKGFTPNLIKKIEALLPKVMDIRFAFAPWQLGESFCRDVLGLGDDKLKRPHVDVLGELGFTKDEIDAANLYCCGAMTVEGASALKDEHRNVFDCAVPSGLTGTRFLSPESHIRMAAAAQPFISGGISKTINLPHRASLADCKKSLLLAYRLGLKSVALYRDGSKLSQPLVHSMIFADQVSPDRFSQLSLHRRALKMGELLGGRRIENSGDRGTKKPLPKKRSGFTDKLEAGPYKLFLRTGEYPDGSLGEVFFDLAVGDHDVQSLFHDFAIALSIGLQYGVPLEDFVRAFAAGKITRRMAGHETGHETGHEPKSWTLADLVQLVFEELASTYLYDHERSRQGITPTRLQEEKKEGERPKPQSIKKSSQTSPLPQFAGPDTPFGFSSNSAFVSMRCSVCGQRALIRTGTCYTCRNCGATSGCA